jgi:hypothetical protein
MYTVSGLTPVSVMLIVAVWLDGPVGPDPSEPPQAAIARPAATMAIVLKIQNPVVLVIKPSLLANCSGKPRIG